MREETAKRIGLVLSRVTIAVAAGALLVAILGITDVVRMWFVDAAVAVVLIVAMVALAGTVISLACTSFARER